MVDGELNFITKLDRSGFDKGVKGIDSSINSLKSSFKSLAKVAAAAFSVKAIYNFTNAAKEAYNVQEQAEIKLTTIMKQRMNATDDMIDSVKALASEQQKLGVIGDEVQLAGAQQVATYLTETESIKTLLPAMNDLLAQQQGLNATSSDAVNIANLMGKAMQGQASALRRVGITFSDAEEEVLKYGTESEKAAMLAQIITNNVGHMNAALAQTDAGKQKQLANTLGDVKEQFGQAVLQIESVFLPVVQKVAEWLTKLASLAQTAGAAIKDVFGVKAETTSAAVASSTRQTADSYEDIEESAKKTEKSQKNQLAAFDKITKLSEDESSSDDSSAASAASTVPLNGTAKLTVEAETSEAGAKLKRFIDDARKKFNSFSGFIKKNFGGIFDGFADGFAYQTGRLKKTFGKITGDLKKLADPLKKWFNGDFLTLLTTSAQTASDIILGLYDSFNTVFADIWNLAVYPCLSSFIDKGLPVLTQFQTQSVLTLGTLFDEVKDIFDRLWADIAEPVFNELSTIFDDVLTDISDAWAEYGEPVFDGLREAIQTTGDIFRKFWNTIGKPIFDKIMSVVDSVWKDHLRPLLKNFLSFVGEFAKGALTIYNKFIAPVVKWLYDKLGPIFTSVFNGSLEKVRIFLSGIIDAASGIISQFKGIATFLTGVFTGDWKKAWTGIKNFFKGVWDTIKSLVMIPFNLITNALKTLKTNWMFGWITIKNYFKNIWEKIGDVVKAPVNVIISGINKVLEGMEWLVNKMIDGLNTISIDVPSALEGIVGFDTFGFDIDHISIPQIPKLAQGTVVPANYGEFLAVLGDNKREAEVVSPYSTIVKAVQDAIGNTNKGGKMTVVVNIQTKSGLRTIGEVAIDEINDITDSTGVIPIKI